MLRLAERTPLGEPRPQEAAREPAAPGRGVQWATVAALLVNMALQMALAASRDTPTYDEPFQVGAAIEKYKNRDLDWAPDHPPVSQLIAGLPLLFVDFDEPEHSKELTGTDSYTRGREYLYQQEDRDGHAAHVIWLARLPIMGFTLATMVVLFLFARDLFGFWGGALALAFGSANPTILAHGRLATTDMVVTGLVLTSIWLIWRSRSSGRPAVMIGAAALVYGLALAAKFTALFMFPFIVLLVLWAAYGHREEAGARAWRRPMVAAAAFVAIGLATVWAVYLGIDPALRYERVVTKAPEGITETVASLLPLPATFKDGLRLQIGWDEAGGRVGFLFGERYRGGKVGFYPAVLAMKNPLALLIGFALGVFAWFRTKRPGRELVMLLLVPFSFLLYAMTSGTNLGVRHVLAVPLFMALVAGAILARPARWGQIAGGVLALWALAATWLSFPSHLAYINEAFGGSGNAYRLVSDSNVDWGQDLVRLRDYLEQHEQPGPIWLAYFGQVAIEAYELPVKIADPEKPEEIGGTFAVSVTKLNSQIPGPYDKLVEDRRPFAQIGHSILLYRLPPSPAASGE